MHRHTRLYFGVQQTIHRSAVEAALIKSSGGEVSNLRDESLIEESTGRGVHGINMGSAVEERVMVVPPHSNPHFVLLVTHHLNLRIQDLNLKGTVVPIMFGDVVVDGEIVLLVDVFGVKREVKS